MSRRVALMFRPDQGNGPPMWLVTLWSHVDAYRRQGWILLADVDDHSVRRAPTDEQPPMNQPRYVWPPRKRRTEGSAGG